MEKIGFLFDLDGVLIDSEEEYTRIWNEIEKRFPTGKPNFASIIKGQTLTKILNDNFPNPEVREKVTDLLHELEQEMTYRYCQGAEHIVNELNRKGGKIAVVTSSDEVKMSHLYRDIPDFRKKISVVIDSSRVKKSKPDPEGYLMAAKEHKVNIKKCVVFEDSVQGVMAGNAAEAYVIGITGTKTREELSRYSDQVVDSLEEVDIEELCKTLRCR